MSCLSAYLPTLWERRVLSLLYPQLVLEVQYNADIHYGRVNKYVVQVSRSPIDESTDKKNKQTNTPVPTPNPFHQHY